MVPGLTARQERPPRATIADIALKASVSKTTVSRALNGKPDIDHQTRLRIFEIASAVGYVPSASAQALAKGRSDCVGLLVPALTWPWMLEILRGVAESVERSSYSLMLYTMAGGEESQREFAEKVIPAGAVDGLAIVLPPGMLESISNLTKNGLPVVLIDDRGHHAEFPSVVTTNREGGLEATKHLLGLGRRRIAMLTGPLEYGCNQDRLEGYRGALGEAGLRFDQRLVREGDFTETGGARAISDLFDAGQDFDAVFAANDLMAFGAMRSLRAGGRRIPEDVAVVGFDDIPAAAQTHPPLTTVHQPLYEMGMAATSMLIAALKDGRPLEMRVEFPTSLVIRGSCGAHSPAKLRR
jgi:LacI family transcriptional regulator